jgi:hypothetical protein
VFFLDNNGFCQYVIDAVSCVFDIDDVVSGEFGDNRDGFTRITTQCEQIILHILIRRVDGSDRVCFVHFSVGKGHRTLSPAETPSAPAWLGSVQRKNADHGLVLHPDRRQELYGYCIFAESINKLKQS